MGSAGALFHTNLLSMYKQRPKLTLNPARKSESGAGKLLGDIIRE